MFKKTALALIGVALAAAVATITVHGQTQDVKQKPRMYSYVSNWTIPRGQWSEMEKATATTQGELEKAFADGTIIGYGTDTNLVHTEDGSSHDSWWSAMSLGGVIKVLEQVRKASGMSPVLSGATKHWDNIYVSEYYNWHPGSWKDVYTYVSAYKLKADAPENAIEQLSKNLIVPLMEKQLADGTIHEYEVDVQAVHTEAPGTFLIVYIGSSPESLDKVGQAIRESIKANPLGGAAFSSMVDFTAHRDELARTSAAYK